VASAKDLEDTVAAIQAGLKDQKKRPNPESAASRWYRIWLNDGPSLSPGEFNALPEKLRRYIHDIETRLDPAGNVKEIASLTEQRDALVALVRELKAELKLKELA
jgi:hypothetical protein